MEALNDAPDIFWSPDLGGYWVIARNELVDEFLQRHDLFSAKKLSVPPVPGAPPLIPNSLDPPDHGPYRKIFMQKMFSPRILAGLEQDFRELSRSAVDAMLPSGACDFMEAYARPAPVSMFLRMLGLPLEERERFMPWVQGVFHPASTDEQAKAFMESAAYLGEWLDEQIANPVARRGGHMLAAMLDARIGERALAKEELLSMTQMLFLAGLDTVTSAMSHAMHFLASSPTHREQLLDEPALAPDAVEELLRRFGISNIARVTARDCEFHGVEFRKGDMVLYSTPMLGLDHHRYQDPLTVDFRRKDKKNHLAFGSGPHLCAGHLLARMELRVMIEETLPRLPNLRVASARLAYESGGTISLKSLPLLWDP